MLIYSQLLAIEKLFFDWCKKEGVAKTPLNVIAFLHVNNLLDKDRVVDFLAEHKTVVKPVTPSGIDWKEWEEFWA